MNLKDLFSYIFDLKAYPQDSPETEEYKQIQENTAAKEHEFGFAVITVFMFVLVFLLIG